MHDLTDSVQIDSQVPVHQVNMCLRHRLTLLSSDMHSVQLCDR